MLDNRTNIAIIKAYQFGGILMKISTNSRYALRLLARVAQKQGERVTTSAAAQAEGISEKMLERIAAKLTREGFLTSVKGIRGGYVLARPADTITVSQVLRVMETPYLPHHCIEQAEQNCKMSSDCNMLCLWKRLDEAICSVTDHVTITDIIRQDEF